MRESKIWLPKKLQRFWIIIQSEWLRKDISVIYVETLVMLGAEQRTQKGLSNGNGASETEMMTKNQYLRSWRNSFTTPTPSAVPHTPRLFSLNAGSLRAHLQRQESDKNRWPSTLPTPIYSSTSGVECEGSPTRARAIPARHHPSPAAVFIATMALNSLDIAFNSTSLHDFMP